jgi:eukaryotic-like serine/threonine-protein kinase
MSAVPGDPGRERTALSIGGVTHVPPDELGLARTQTPPPVALDRTRTPRPADLDRTHTTSDARTPPPDGDDAASASPLVAATVLSNGDGASRLARPPRADEDPRVKDLVRARLFRNKAKPVKIGRFTVLGRLGEGGMGIVYTAYDDQLDRKVAVKVLRGEATRQDQLGRTRLLREAQAMARLSHPNIVTVHEVGALDDQVFVAMEFVRGQSLDGWLRRQPRAWRDVLLVFRQAGRGLEAAHRAGIVHRDFKPHNVLVGDDGSIKVLDFGLARAAEHPGSEELAATPEGGAYNHSQGNLLDAPLTRTGAIMGTPAYMAPEQHSGLPATALSDQFSFCVSLWEGLYGAHPFDCATLATLVAGVSTGELREPPAAAKVPARLRRALLRGLSVEPAQRWPSMTELLAELARDPAQARRRWLVTAGLAGFVGAASFGAASLLPAEVAVCQGAAEELVGAWDDARAAAVERALLATGVPYAADTWSRVRPRLDAYAAEWTAMRTEACETHRAAKQSDQLFDLRTACLDQRRASLTALVEILAAADAAVVEKAATAAAGLPTVAACGDVDALTQAVAPPEDPAVRARVQELRTTLARARTFEDAGRAEPGLALVEPVLTAARALEYAPLTVEALLLRGSLEMLAGRYAAAEASLGESLW